MFCRNCQQDTGNKNECPYCGYNPALDGENAAPHALTEHVAPKDVRITLNKAPNGKATAALVLSFFSFAIIPGIISFFLAIAGFFQAKKCRCGRVKTIFALLITGFWAFLYFLIIYGNL